MNAQHFQTQLERLISVYGKQHYPKERAQIIWLEVKDFSDFWFTRTIDFFIGYQRQAPLLTEFREQISRERERIYSIEKTQHTKEAEEFMSSYGGDDLKMICEQIRKRVRGHMSDSDFECFQKLLDKKEQYKCPRCEDTRIYQHATLDGFFLCDHRF